MAYLYLNLFDNLTSGSRNFDDFYTQSLAEQYEGIKRRLGRNAPEDLQKFVAMCCPYSESEYYISMPALIEKFSGKSDVTAVKDSNTSTMWLSARRYTGLMVFRNHWM